MKKIREFAVLCGTTPKTLRFYDKIGLLEASYIDPENGYRYYNDEQIRDFGIISCFKAIGFTLDEIKNEILNSDDEHILEILHRKEAELNCSLRLCREQIGLYEKRTHRKRLVRRSKIPGIHGRWTYTSSPDLTAGKAGSGSAAVCPDADRGCPGDSHVPAPGMGRLQGGALHAPKLDRRR